jgi:mono/diheme cytochrome c family protein
MPDGCRFITVFVFVTSLAAAAHAADRGNTAGHAVFQRWCAGCHADSPFAPGTVALKAVRDPGAAVLEQRTDLNPVLIRTMVRHGFGGMPSFRRIEISADELDALVAYLSGSAGSGDNR